jgi:glycosyltransferase involved in cell wall biosynthesis
MKNRVKFRLVIVAPHPVQYHFPLFKEVEKLSNIDSKVLYCDDMGVEEIYDEEFKTTIKWDIPMLDGYKYKFLKNYSLKPYSGFFSRINPTILSEISKNKYDAILIHGYDKLSCWLAFFAAKLAGIKVIWRGESTLRGGENSAVLKKRLKKIVLTKLFNACDAVMYSCTGNKDYLKFYGAHESKLFPIPCAVDNDFYRSERKKYLGKEKGIKKELGIEADDFVVLFSARFTTRKRPLDLLKAIRKIKHDNILLLFVGAGIERRNMEKYVQKHRVRALFAGFQNQSEISKYYSVSDVAIVVSDYDPSPKAMNEAMSFELPIIVTDVVGTAYDLVKDGENGFVVKVGDVDTIAEKIDYLNKNRAMAKAMGKKSWEIVKDWNFHEDAKWLEKSVKFVMNGRREADD